LSAPHVDAWLSKELEDWLAPLRGRSSAALRARMVSVESSIPVRSMIPAITVGPSLETDVRARKNRRVDQDSLNAIPDSRRRELLNSQLGQSYVRTGI
jgi:hypothetical protein